MRSAPFSPIIIAAGLMLPEMIVGMIDAVDHALFTYPIQSGSVSTSPREKFAIEITCQGGRLRKRAGYPHPGDHCAKVSIGE